MSWDRWHYSGERSFSVKGKSTKIALSWALLFGGSYIRWFRPPLFAEVRPVLTIFFRGSWIFSFFYGIHACSRHLFIAEERLVLATPFLRKSGLFWPSFLVEVRLILAITFCLSQACSVHLFFCGSQAFSGHLFRWASLLAEVAVVLLQHFTNQLGWTSHPSIWFKL